MACLTYAIRRTGETRYGALAGPENLLCCPVGYQKTPVLVVVVVMGGHSLLASPEKAAPDVIQVTAGQPYFPTETLTDEQGAVVVAVTQIKLNCPGETLDLEVVMDTLSVDLSMDLAQNASLTTDPGLTVSAFKWDAPSGGYHVSGSWVFPSAWTTRLC